jgi:hypothetical protein
LRFDPLSGFRVRAAPEIRANLIDVRTLETALANATGPAFLFIHQKGLALSSNFTMLQQSTVAVVLVVAVVDQPTLRYLQLNESLQRDGQLVICENGHRCSVNCRAMPHPQMRRIRMIELLHA